jgi:hypothetical protein
VKPEVHQILERDGFLDSLGEDMVHGNVYRAVEVQIGESGTASRES